MKVVFETKRAGNRALAAVVLVLTVLSACSKDPKLVEEAGKVNVRVVNGAAGSVPQDFYINNNIVNAQAVAYNESTAYIEISGGNGRNAEFKNAGTGTVNFTGQVDLVPGENYTFFYTGKFSGAGNSSAVFKDDKTNPSTIRARVRFVNLAAGFDSANLTVTGGSNIATNIAFGNASTFNEIDAGTVTLQTALYNNPSAPVSLGSFTLQAGKLYTVFTSGSLSGTVSAKLIAY